MLSGCGLHEFNEQRAKLQPLVDRHAAKQEVVHLLGTNYITYRKTDPNWQTLTNIFAAERKTYYPRVRESLDKWATVLLFSTPDIMTWVFLDEQERIVDIEIGAQ